MKQEVYFNEDDKLCIIANKGELLNGFCRVPIKGEFTISAEDVVKLLHIINKQNVVLDSYYANYKTWYIATKDVLTEANKSLAEEMTFLNKTLNDRRDKIDFLLKSIEDFNDSRRFYERKLELKNN